LQNNNQISEYELGNNYLHGNDDALGKLYVYYYQSLVMIAYKYTTDTEKSRDVVGAVFEKLLQLETQKRQQIILHPQKGLYPFLVTVVKNKCLDGLKTNKLQEEIKKHLVTLVLPNSTNAAFIRFEVEAIKQLLNNLPKREREMIELHLQGFKNEEIAVQLNISYNTVRNTLHNAKQRIKKLWQLFM
jgi:RNA polymerase sigma-70 factor (ECF subfamily)